jgi:hypothetical protein
MCRRSGFVGGRGSRLAAGRTPLVGAAAQAASGSRSWRHRRGGRARRWRPPHRWWPDRRRAAPRTAPAAPRSAGPGPGRATSPPDQCIEHKFEGESATLLSPTGAAQRLGEPPATAAQRNLGGQQWTGGANEPRGQRPVWSDELGRESPGSALSRQPPQGLVRLFSTVSRPACGRPPQAAALGRRQPGQAIDTCLFRAEHSAAHLGCISPEGVK